MNALRVLVVDDEYWIRMAVIRALRDFTVSVRDVGEDVRFEIDEAETGEEAVAKIGVQPPHILLLDMKLPGIGGLEVLEHVASQKLNTLVIMITAYASIETAVVATKRGAYDFLAKPFTPEELENALGKAARHIVVAEHARRLAQEKQQVRFQFISVLAHELKAPLNAIEGYLQAIHDRTAGDNPKIYERMLDRSLVRTRFMRKLILDLLDLTRIESGQKQRELAAVVLGDVAAAAIETTAPDAAERNIAVELKCASGTTMNADRDEIEIVLNNLISNAIKYNREGGKVTVDINRSGNDVTLAVSDTGIGIDKDDLARLFESFVRIKTEKTVDILGSGLGLSIVKKIALLYNGTVSVASEPEVGSTFTVVLRDAKEG